MSGPAIIRKYHLGLVAVVLCLDRVSKWLVEEHVPLHDSINVIPGFFRITHVENRGAAFGLFADSSSDWKVAMLILFSVMALAVVSTLLWRNSHGISTTGIGLALIMGGALGNLWDRLKYGHVLDFLGFYLRGYQWPDFNVADSAIVVGALLLMADILFAAHEDPAPAARLEIERR